METTTLWQFNTRRFRVELTMELDQDTDLSWRTPEQAASDVENDVEYYQFACVVYLDDREIACDTLGGSGYSNPLDFVREHRTADPLDRNCSIMRAARGENVAICHYFPGMVGAAIHQAREVLKSMPIMRRDQDAELDDVTINS